MRRLILSALLLFSIMTLATGILYPLLVTGMSRLLFPFTSQGSLRQRKGVIVGSVLIAQNVRDPAYFWPRPSASHYGTMPAGASNLGPMSKVLRTQAEKRQEEWMRANGSDSPVPPEMMSASASGLDPETSPEAAMAQLDRIARARSWKPGQARAAEELIKARTEKPLLNFIGTRRINVFLLNLALDDI